MFNFLKFGKSVTNKRTPLPIYFHNTLGNEKQGFEPPEGRSVRVYSCGPTPYDTQHIGNLSAAVFADVLRRAFEYNHLKVKQVMNITDFGHLTSDADEGEDKMTKGLKREGLTPSIANMRKLAEKYTEIFLNDLNKLNIDTSKVEYPRASDHIPAQIALIQTLDEKGYAYKTKDGVYFDTSRFPTYGELGGVNKADQKEGAPTDAEAMAGKRVTANPEKRNPQDFALWKFNDELGWDAPWGKGFPGWHIECSAMNRSCLGEQIDIHTGGIEHIGVHHNNEIAQSEAATGKEPFSRFWLHRAHIQLDGGKMAKSEGSVVYLSDVVERGFHPLAYRYWLLTGHYRTPMNFTWEALDGAQNALLKLHHISSKCHLSNQVASYSNRVTQYLKKFHERVNDDLDTPGALALTWDMAKDSKLTQKDLCTALLEMDKVLGIGLTNPDEKMKEMLAKEFGKLVPTNETPATIKELVEKRETARKEKDWDTADKIRDEIASLGYTLKDSPEGVQVLAKHIK